MNVAMLSSAFYPHLGGVEELVRQLAHAYRRLGMSCIVITNRWPRTLPAHEDFEGIPLYRLALRVPDGSLKARLNYYLSNLLIRSQLYRILRRHRIDLLHVQCVSANGHYAAQASRKLKLPLVVSTHGERTIDSSGLFQRSEFMNRVLRRLLARADYITACSSHTLNDMECYWGQRFGARGAVVYNGVEPGDFNNGVSAYQHPRPYILAIGRLVSQKGFDVLLRAYARSQIQDLDLLIAGEGTDRRMLEELSRNLGLSDRVHFLGRAERPLAVALFKGCAFVAMPSREEPQGIVALETMAAGKAIVASRAGGIPEMVTDGEHGLLVGPGDEESLAAALHRLAGNPALREQLAERARQRVRQFTWPATAAHFARVYESILRDNGPQASCTT